LTSPPSLVSDRATVPQAKRPSSLVLGVALAAILLLWCFNYVAGKVALRHMDPYSLVSIRMEIAALVMLAIYFSRSGRRRVKLGIRELWTFTWLGFFGVIINQGCYTIGLNYTTSQHSVIIFAVAPIVVLLLARAIGLEALTTAKIMGMFICCGGILLLESEHGFLAHSPLVVGDLYTLAGVVGFAVYAVFGKRIAGNYDAVALNTFNSATAAVLVLPLAVRQALVLDWHAVGWAGWAGMAYMAIGSSVLAYTIFYWVLRHMEASRVAAVQYLEPLVVILVSIPFLGERPTWHLVAGGALVLVGVYLAERVSW
jgi:drug/metabolite transporter (DMT)-like permease